MWKRKPVKLPKTFEREKGRKQKKRQLPTSADTAVQKNIQRKNKNYKMN